MTKIQHTDALRALGFIIEAYKAKEALTYQTLAIKLGRDFNTNAKAVAQMCDKLDAAAAIAGVPLLALRVVRNVDGEINPKAFKKRGALRDKIIERSLAHYFTEDDFLKMKEAMEGLQTLGNRKSWALVRTTTDAYGQ
jgi:hypothetical protein